MSLRRSSRIKKLEIDDTTRQKILFQPGLAEDGLAKGRSIHAGKIRDLPYSRTNGVNRLLRGVQDPPQQQRKDKVEGDSSPLRKVLGKLTDKFQEAIKGIFPFKLFSQPEAQPEEESKRLPESNNIEGNTESAGTFEPSRQSNERLVQCRSRSLEQVQETLPVPDVDAEKDARRQAYAELSAFFSAKKGQSVGPADLSKVSHLFSTNPSPRPARTTFPACSSGVLMTPLPRKMAAAADQQQATISRMSSVQRIAPAPTTALKFRTRVPVPAFPPVVERAIVDEDVQAELVKSTRASPVKQSSMKVDDTEEKVMSQEPSPKKEKKDQRTPNRFVGLFFLDPDEEEEELLRQDREAQERQKRIETLAAKKEQRERKIAFRLTNEETKEAQVEEAKSTVAAAAAAVPAPLFDFGPSLTGTPRKEPVEATKPVAEEKPLINLGTPVKPAAAAAAPLAFEFPSSTTRIGSADEDRDSKRKRPAAAKPAESLFKPSSEIASQTAETGKPLFSFAPSEKPEEAKPVEPVAPVKFSFAPPVAQEQKEEEKAEKPIAQQPVTFSFAPVAQVTPSAETAPSTAASASVEAPKLAFSFAPPTSATSEKSAATFTFPATPAEPALTESKPTFTFGTAAPTETPKPAFTFPSIPATTAATAEAKPAFSFAPAVSKAEIKPAFTFAPAATEAKPATSVSLPPATSTSAEAKPVPSFGSVATEKPVFSFGTPAPSTATSAPPFTFGQQNKASEPAKPPAFSFAPTSAAVSFGQPAATGTEPKPFTFGAAPTTEAKPFTFGTATDTKPSIGFGSASAFGSSAPSTANAPSPFTFGQQQQQPSGMDMQMEDDGMAQPAPTLTSAFGGTSAFGFGSSNNPNAGKPFSFASGPSPAPSSVTTPTFNFASPSPTSQFTFGQNSAAPAPATSPFSFGQPAQQQPQPFVFGAQPNAAVSGMDALASAAAPGGGFNVGAGGSVTGARKTGPMTRPRRR